MSNIFIREPLDGGDTGVWATKELPQNRLSIGAKTCQLYDDSGTLKLTVGKIGFDNSSLNGVFEMDTIETISIASVSNSNWAKVEIALSGTSPVITATNITGATSPGTLPSEFTGAYDPEKGGYYIDSSKRCIGIVWINAGGTLEGIVNADSVIQGYHGYSTSDDSLDFIYNFDFSIDSTKDSKYVGSLYMIPEADRPGAWVLSGGTSAAYADVDFSNYVPVGTKAVLLNCMFFFTGDGSTDSTVAAFRKKGSSETSAVKNNYTILYHTNLASGIEIAKSRALIIECDIDGIIQYSVGAAGAVFLNIMGYYI